MSDWDSDSDSDSGRFVYRASAKPKPAARSVSSSDTESDDEPHDHAPKKRRASCAPSTSDQAASSTPCHPTAASEQAAFVVAHLKHLLPEVASEEADDALEFDQKVWPAGWEPKDSRVHVGASTEQLFASNRPVIPYVDLAKAADVENLRGTRGASGSGFGEDERDPFDGCTHLAHKSNRETRTLVFCINNAEAIMGPVLMRTGAFPLTPQQRLFIGLEIVGGIDEDVTISVRKHKKPAWKAKDALTQTIEAGTRPPLRFWTVPTGCGKTAMAICTYMTKLCNPTLWQATLASWRKTIYRRRAGVNLGLCNGPSLETSELARVVIVYAPLNVMQQWQREAESVRAAMVAEKGCDFLIWYGVRVLQTKKKGRESIKMSLGRAHKLDKPLLWIVPLETTSIPQTIRSDPELFYATKIIDEATVSCEARSDEPESQPLEIAILQATVGRLEKVSWGAPRHPVRVAFGGNFDPTRLYHSLQFACCSIANWQRQSLWQGIAPLMPSVEQFVVRTPFKTLAGHASGSDLNLSGLDEVISSMLKQSMRLGVQLDNRTRMDLLDRCKRMLAVSRDETIVGRLRASIDDAEAQRTALGHAVEFEHERLALGVFVRLFTKLVDAMDGDTPPECPFDLDVIPQDKIGLAKCCSCMLNIDNIEYCTRCPNCRKPDFGVADVLGFSEAIAMVADASASAETQAARKAARKAQIEEEEAAKARRLVEEAARSIGDDELLVTRLHRLSDKVWTVPSNPALQRTSHFCVFLVGRRSWPTCTSTCRTRSTA